TGYKSLDDPSVQPWDELNETLKSSYLMQAQHIPEKLQKLHYNIRKVNDEPKYFKFSDEEIEILAEMEHERWFREKMEDGWTYNHEIDNELKNSPYLVPWEDLPDNIKEFDRDSVREIPEILKKAGFEIYSIL
ncbi:MAG: RyR domain-containing protein, partial [Methanobacterium sp.]